VGPLDPASVSPREAEVLDAVGAHLSNAQIAHQLSISVRTVESHVSALLRKCGAASRRELAGFAAARPAGSRSQTDVECGEAALRRGDWTAARDAFQAALTAGAGPRARNGLGQALWWLDQVTEAIEQRELAYAEFRRDDDDRSAVKIALWLARTHLVTSGARAVSNGWLHRAERLLAGTADCAERGWYHWLLAKMAGSPADAVAEARRAWKIAVSCGDRDLEACALSELGLAEVMCGDVAQGMAELDEALAAATGGEVADLGAVGDTCCNMVSACEAAADISRGAEWCAITMNWASRNNNVPMLATCRSAYAGILVATGRWAQAERELATADDGFRRHYPAIRVRAAAQLALLRVYQGRLADAEAALAGCEGRPAAAGAVAAIHLAAGRRSAAAAVARRRLTVLGADSLAAAPFLMVLAEAEPASDAAARLAELARRTGSRPLVGWAALAAAGTSSHPHAELDRAIDAFAEAGMPYFEGLARMRLAGLLGPADTELAAAEAATALRIFEALGAAGQAAQARALLPG
jgi:DNA-binding CsgD family transcriptional regulator